MNSIQYNFVFSILMPLFSFAFYQRFLDKKTPLKAYLFVCPIYTVLKMSLFFILPEPFFVLIPIAVIFALLKWIRIFYSFSHAFFTLSLVLFVHLTCRLFCFYLLYWRGILSIELLTIVSVAMEIFAYLVIHYHIDKLPKLFKSKNTESKVLLNTIALIIFSLYILTVLIRPYSNNMVPFSFLTFQFYLLIIIPLTGLVFFLVFYMNRIRVTNSEIKDKMRNLSRSFGQLPDKQDHCHPLFPNLVATFQGLINEFEHLIGKNESQQIQRIENYISLIYDLNLHETQLSQSQDRRRD